MQIGCPVCSSKSANKVPSLPDGCDWSEADLQPLKLYLEKAASEGFFAPDPNVPWDTVPVM